MNEKHDEPEQIDLAPLSTPLAEVPVAIVNRMERERNRELASVHIGLSTVLKLMVRVSQLTWDSIRFLCTDSERDPGRRLEFALAVPPLTRTILDSLFTVIFLFDNPTANARNFFASGWREFQEDHQRLLARHGNDPIWRQWLPKHAGVVESFAVDAAICQDERKNPKEVKRWPNPGKMAFLTQDVQRRAFLEFLNDWFYRQLSRDSHLSLPGLLHRAIHLSDPARSDDGRERLEMYKWGVVFTSISTYTAFLSELASQFRFEHEGRRLHQVWQHLQRWPEARDLYQERYEKGLPT